MRLFNAFSLLPRSNHVWIKQLLEICKSLSSPVFVCLLFFRIYFHACEVFLFVTFYNDELFMSLILTGICRSAVFNRTDERYKISPLFQCVENWLRLSLNVRLARLPGFTACHFYPLLPYAQFTVLNPK